MVFSVTIVRPGHPGHTENHTNVRIRDTRDVDNVMFPRSTLIQRLIKMSELCRAPTRSRRMLELGTICSSHNRLDDSASGCARGTLRCRDKNCQLFLRAATHEGTNHKQMRVSKRKRKQKYAGQLCDGRKWN